MVSVWRTTAIDDDLFGVARMLDTAVSNMKEGPSRDPEGARDWTSL